MEYWKKGEILYGAQVRDGNVWKLGIASVSIYFSWIWFPQRKLLEKLPPPPPPIYFPSSLFLAQRAASPSALSNIFQILTFQR